METSGLISEEGQATLVLLDAYAEGLTGVVSVRPESSSEAFLVAVAAGRAVGAWGGGAWDSPAVEEARMEAPELLNTEGDQALLRVMYVDHGRFDVTPGEAVVAGPARVSGPMAAFLYGEPQPEAGGASPRRPLSAAPPSSRRARPATGALPVQGRISPGFPADRLLGWAGAESLTGTIEIHAPRSQIPFTLALVRGEMTGAWGGGADGDPSLTTRMVGAMGLGGTSGDRVFAMVRRLDAGSFALREAAPAVPDGALLTPLPLQGRIEAPEDVDRVLAAALAHRFTGTAVVRHQDDPAPFLRVVGGLVAAARTHHVTSSHDVAGPCFLGLVDGVVVAAWGGGADLSSGSAARVLRGLGHGDPANAGDLAFARAVASAPARFELAPRESLVPATVMLGQDLEEHLRRRFVPPGLPSPSASSQGDLLPGPGTISDDLTVERVLRAAHRERFTGTISVLSTSSRDPFRVAFRGGLLKAAWGGSPGGGDQTYFRVKYRVRSGIYWATPGTPVVPAAAQVSRSLARSERAAT